MTSLWRTGCRAYCHPYYYAPAATAWLSRDVKRSTPTQHPTIPWSSLLRQRTRQCSTLQLTQQGWGNYQEPSGSLSLYGYGTSLSRRHDGKGSLLQSGQVRAGAPTSQGSTQREWKQCPHGRLRTWKRRWEVAS